MITEVYISIDNQTFTKLDLYKNESIEMKYVTKDLQDISKVFSPYSQSFTFEATPKNRMALGFFGDTDVIKSNLLNTYFCKIYTNGSLNLTGYLSIESVSYKNQNASYFTCSFTTSMTNLKDRIGDTLISDLGSYEILWKPTEVKNMLTGVHNDVVEGIPITWYVPLISSERVWASDPTYTAGLKDNVAYNVASAPTSNELIKSTELRPAMSYSTLIELIKKKYNLQVLTPLDTRPEFTDAYVWCNSETFYNPKEVRFDLFFGFTDFYYENADNEEDIPDPKKYYPTANTVDNTINVLIQEFDNDWDKFFAFEMYFTSLVSTSNSNESNSVVINIKRVGTDEVLISQSFDITGDTFKPIIYVSDDFFIANSLDFYVTCIFKQPTSWGNVSYDIFFKFYDDKYSLNKRRFATYIYNSPVNNNSDLMFGNRIDLIKSLPPIKIIDFLNSYLKVFNINIFDTSPNNENLFWLTPQDINSTGNEYSKLTVDYTPYISFTNYNKSTASDYNYYNFKHATSKYKSNVDYLKAAGMEYGQTTYPSIKPTVNLKEYKIETTYSLMVPVALVGTSDVITYYGFNSEQPTILETGESRYKPNYGELTIFYINDVKTITTPLGYQNQATNGVLINDKLESYIQTLPWNMFGNSLGFSILVYNNFQYTDSLFQRYYSNQIQRLLNPNVLTQEFEGILPPDELYLNDAGYIQGLQETPVGFRLQNDIIISENKFSIIDVSVDITTGKAKFTLLNY